MQEEKKRLPVLSRLGVIFLTWRRYQEKVTKSSGLTLNQYYILKQLSRKDYLNPSEIAEMMFCDRPTATVIIDNLKKYGFITKEKDAEDGKRIQVRITQAGVEQERKCETALTEQIKFDPLACFSKEEQDIFEELLMKLHHHIKDLG
jgi:DNA-binding MarR family transcriptional regulator